MEYDYTVYRRRGNTWQVIATARRPLGGEGVKNQRLIRDFLSNRHLL